MNDLIVTQLTEEFKRMLEEIMVRERKKYLEENKDRRTNGYYQRKPRTILGELELDIPRTRDNGFKPSILPERKRVTFLLDDAIRLLFVLNKVKNLARFWVYE